MLQWVETWHASVSNVAMACVRSMRSTSPAFVSTPSFVNLGRTRWLAKSARVDGATTTMRTVILAGHLSCAEPGNGSGKTQPLDCTMDSHSESKGLRFYPGLPSHQLCASGFPELSTRTRAPGNCHHSQPKGLRKSAVSFFNQAVSYQQPWHVTLAC